jgi:uncharacterized protein HemX
MDSLQIAYTVALTIGAAIVSWAALRVESLQQRVTALETKLSKCTCK